VTFVDSDDYVAQNYFDVLDSAGDCDLLVFAHENVGGQPLDEIALFEELERRDTAAQKLELLMSSRKIMSPWNKRFKRKIIQRHNLAFIEGLSVGEDFNFCTAYAMHSETIWTVKQKLIFNDVSDQTSLSRKYRPSLDKQISVVFEHIYKTISEGGRSCDETEKLLEIVDYLYIKHVFSCISEEFKQKKMNYLKDRQRIGAICEKFRWTMAAGRVNLVHRILRLALNWKVYYPFYLVSYWVKGRKYRT